MMNSGNPQREDESDIAYLCTGIGKVFVCPPDNRSAGSKKMSPVRFNAKVFNEMEPSITFRVQSQLDAAFASSHVPHAYPVAQKYKPAFGSNSILPFTAEKLKPDIAKTAAQLIIARP